MTKSDAMAGFSGLCTRHTDMSPVERRDRQKAVHRYVEHCKAKADGIRVVGNAFADLENHPGASKPPLYS